MPIGTSEGTQHEDDTSFHIDQMYNDTVYDDQPTEQQLTREMQDVIGKPLTIGTYDYLKNEERGMEAKQNQQYRETEDEAFGNKSTDYTPVNYKEWLNDQSKKLGRDVFQDTKDYDLESYYKDHKGEDMNAGHMTDKYKLPNHITFSSESKYHGTPEEPDMPTSKDKEAAPAKMHEGGNWDKLEDGSWTFSPGRSNLEQHSTQELIDYFKKYEKGNHLLLPNSFVDSGNMSKIPRLSSVPEDVYPDRFKDLPKSTNIDDRRNEIGVDSLLQSWTGLTPDAWGEAIKHPMTPFRELYPGLKGGDNENSELSADAGINNIGLSRHNQMLEKISKQ